MGEPLSIYGEISSLSWTKKKVSRWRTASSEGQALYWEWKPDAVGLSPEDFLLFTRTVFPNGGCVVEQHSNNSLIWSPIDGDIYAVGIRKLKHHSVWVISVLECPEEYPGASQCPDKVLSLKATRFIAMEFLRATNPIDIFNCEVFLVNEDSSWWEYLSKLEKIINWKFPELRRFQRLRTGNSTFNRNVNLMYEELNEPASEARDRQRNHREHRSTNRKDRSDGLSRISAESRIRSPPGRSYDTTAEPSKPPSTKAGLKTGDINCMRCGQSFEHSYELMRHLNSEQHREALSREFPI